jgi:hypothetical protein
MFRRYALHERQPEALPRGVEAVVGADNRAEGRLDVLERHAAEFAWPGGADHLALIDLLFDRRRERRATCDEGLVSHAYLLK